MTIRILPPEEVVTAFRPRIVCLCGSTRFRPAFEAANRHETLAGRIVLAPGVYGHADGLEPDPETKRTLDQLHFRKIALSDEILVINVGNYIGESTRAEILYAQEHGKPIRYWEPAP